MGNQIVIVGQALLTTLRQHGWRDEQSIEAIVIWTRLGIFNPN